MYDPVKDGVEKSVGPLIYVEMAPPAEFAELVHCYWQMRTETELEADFVLHALPDACVNVLFDQSDSDIAGVTALHTEHTTLDLGRSFHYLGVQLYPGVWTSAFEGTVDHYVGEAYEGDLPLIDTNRTLADVDVELAAKEPVLSAFVRDLLERGAIASNPVTATILRRLDEITSVADMAALVGFSPRQLQRNLKQTTGFSPHDLLKVLRLQHSFRNDYLLAFADQSHYTHSFRAITGYTPARFRERFDV